MNGSNAQKKLETRQTLLTAGLWIGGAMMLGLLMGVLLAVFPWHAWILTPAAEVRSATVVHGATIAPGTIASGTMAPVVAAAAPGDEARTSSPMARPVRVVKSLKAAHGRRVAHRKRHRRHKGIRKAKPAIAAAAAKLEMAPFSDRVEGDASVVEYDARRGRVYTSEGAEFVLNEAGGPDTRQGYAPYLHYHCDLAGACTVGWSGLVYRSAKLAAPRP